MRLLDEAEDRSLDRITLYLTLTEAAELRDSLNALLAKQPGTHQHVPSDDLSKELTVCTYDEGALNAFNERSRRLILEDT